MLKGQCGCGAVTYTMSSPPIAVHCCHCRDCQCQSGSAYVLNAIIEADRVTCEGPLTRHSLSTDSGEGQVITRCAECGVAVFSSYLIRKGKLTHIRVGTLDDPSACRPDVQIFTASKQPWVPLVPEIPQFEAYYDIREVWSADAIDRWDALFPPAP